jgi:hypothetical protein
MPAEVALEIVPGATHLFEEPGTVLPPSRATGSSGIWLQRLPRPIREHANRRLFEPATKARIPVDLEVEN